MSLTNDVAEFSGVVRLTLADVTLDTDGRDCSFKFINPEIYHSQIYSVASCSLIYTLAKLYIADE